MPIALTRRSLLIGSALLYPAVMLVPGARADDDDVDQQLAALEKRTGGRLGVSVMDTGTNVSFSNRETERFPLLSTFKVLASGMVLARVDKGEENLERRVTYDQDKIVTYSPETEKHIGAEGMTVGELCK